MFVVERAVLAPACCTVCMGASGPFIDTLRTFDSPGLHARTGRIYLCLGCVTRGASELGLIAESVAPVEAERDEAVERADALAEENKALRDFKELAERFAPKPKRGRPRKKKKTE